MISRKNYDKVLRNLPEGFDTANEFFDYVCKDREMIWMGQNTNHLHENPEIMEAMIQCITSREFSKYPPPEGFPELKRLILEDLGLKNGFEAIITAGGTESLFLCMEAVLNPEDNVITCDPGYLIIDNFANRFCDHVKSVPIYQPENNYKLTPDLVKKNMDSNTKLISLVDPLNPLGSCYNKQEIKEFADLAYDQDIYLLHDITYRDFARKHYLAAEQAPDRTITVYSFSKIYGMAGLRIGAIVCAPEVMESVRNVIINDLGTNAVSQYGAIASINSKVKWLNKIRKQTAYNQIIIKEAVDEIEGTFLPVYPSDGNMIAIDMYDTGVKPLQVSNYLLQKKLFVREGSYTSKRFGHRYLRVSFSIPPEQVEYFAESFKEAMKVLKPSN